MRAQTNANYAVSFVLTRKSDGAAYSLDGMSLRMQMKMRPGVSATATFQTSDGTLTITGSESNIIALVIDKAVMAGIAPGNYSYDVVRLVDTDNAYLLFGGVWPVFAGVTNDPSVYLPFRGTETAIEGDIGVVVDDDSEVSVMIAELQGIPGTIRPLPELTSGYDAYTAYSWLTDPNAVPVFIYDGQSLADFTITAGQTQNPITTAPVHPGIVLCPQTAEQNAAAGMVVPARQPQGETIIGFTDLYEYNTTFNGHMISESGLSGFGNTFVEQLHAALGRWVPIVVFTAAVGGLTYMELKKGSAPYEALLKNASEVAALLYAQGKRPIFLAVPWEQGQDDTNSFSGAEKYARYMAQIQRHLEADLRAISGQVEPVLLIVTQDSASFFVPSTTFELVTDTIVLDTPAIGQLRAAEHNPGRIVLAGAQYDCDLTPQYHNPHFSSRGYLLDGTRNGRIAARVLLGADHRGLKWIDSQTEWVDSYTVQLQYDVPLIRGDGSTTPDWAAGVLTFDTSGTIVSVAGLFDSSNFGCGFSLMDRQGTNTEVNKIVWVEVFNPGGNSRKNNVRIHFNRPQAGPSALTCAIKQNALQGVYGNLTINNRGTGGTDGTYDLIFTGGNPSVAPASGQFTVLNGSIVPTSTNPDLLGFLSTGGDPGYGYQTTPTVSTANCPGLVGASLTAQLVAVLSYGPYYGSRSLLRTSDASLTTVAGDVASYDWACSQFQVLPPSPVPQKNILRNPRGRVNQRAPSSVSDGQKIHDGWYTLLSTGTVAPSTMVDSTFPDLGSFLRLTNNTGSALHSGLLQVVPFDKTSLLRGLNVTMSAWARRTNPASLNRCRFSLLSWNGTQDQPVIDVVNDWTSNDFTTPGAFYISNANYTILGTGFLDSQNVLRRPIELVLPVPSGAKNLVYFFFAAAGQIAGEAMDLQPVLELGSTQTGCEDIEDWRELDMARRFYGTMQVPVVNGQSQYVPWPRRLYATPAVTVTAGTGSATSANATVDGVQLTGTGTGLVTVTWDTGL